MRFFLFCLFLFPFTAGAQSDSLGQWRALQAYRFGAYVTESENSIIYTTGRTVFYLDKDDLSITRLSKDDGLAEASVRLINYHQPTETLIIVYESGVIDLYDGNSFTTLRQIDNFNLNGDKTIYGLFAGADNVIYISTGFGVTALDLNNQTFLFTTFTGVRVNNAAELGGFLYAATDEGVYRVAQEGTNLNDFGNWELLGAAQGLPEDYTSTVVNVYRGELYFGVNLDLYRLNGNAAEIYYDEDDNRPFNLSYLSVGPNLLMAGYTCFGIRDCRDRQLAIFDENGLRRTTPICTFVGAYAIEDDRGRIWFADDPQVEFIDYIENADSDDCVQLEYPGPFNDRNYRLFHDGTSLWVAPGILDENFGFSFRGDGVYRLTDGQWSTFNPTNTPALGGIDGVRGNDNDLLSIVDVYYDPINDTHWFSSFYEGAASFDNTTETAELIDERNSSLSFSAGAGPGRIRVAGAVNDPDGFTYLANSRAEDGAIVAVRSPDGEWADLGTDCELNLALSITIDNQGYIWVVHTDNIGGGLTVIDTDGTPMDPSDDRCRTITINNSNLPTSGVRSIAVDLEGVVWVGTSQGIILFECGASVFDVENCGGRLPVARADDFGGFLLETEEIRAITVDGGNRKWIATSSGAYLLSPDGEEQILFFDAGNSPLLANLVRDVAIDPNTGTVYFGTDLGISSFRSEATAASRFFREELTIFPNPVEPGYDGPIAIQGLVRDARVKVTDISGKLVAEGTAVGGQFVWDGSDYNGRRVQTGVYLVFTSSNIRFGGADPESAVGKIVFIR